MFNRFLNPFTLGLTLSYSSFQMFLNVVEKSFYLKADFHLIHLQS
jgi:hypothetical protein